MRRWIFVLLLVILLPIIGFLVFVTTERRVFVLKSRASFQEVSGSNSLAISTPSCAKAGGEEISRLTVYCLNNQGLGVENLPLVVSPSRAANALGITAIQGTSDALGKAIFDITSGIPGIFELQIDCGSARISTSHKVCFN